MIVTVLPQAETDIIRQFRYYLVDQDVPIVAVRFRAAVKETIEALRKNPGMGSVYRSRINNLRSFPIKGFSAFRLFYVSTPDAIQVVRLIHVRRNIGRILAKEIARLG